MNDKLKKCPFCGHDAEYNNNFNGWAWIECSNCEAKSGSEMIAHGDEILIKAWNTRIKKDE